MTLTTTVTNILCRRVTDEEAKEFALNNYGILATYIRQQFVDDIQHHESKYTKIKNYGKSFSRKI